MINIKVKILNDTRECSVSIEKEDFVPQLKQLVSEQLYIPISEQKLIYEGRTLSDDQSLDSQNIKDGCRLHLVFKKSASSVHLLNELHTFLRPHFTESDCKKISERFDYKLAQMINDSSWDDLERFASWKLQNRIIMAVNVAAVKRKVQKSKEYQTLENLCQQNNVNIKTIKHDGGNYGVLEMFFGGYPDLIGLKFFSALAKLVLIGQDICNIGNIKHVSSTLSELWICESKIKKLDGLEKCVKLKKLYLYDNFIEDGHLISNLIDLDVLWLNNNQIHSIKFLEKLFSLTEINLAKNNITDNSLKEMLTWPPYMSNLNLSQNNVMQMKSLMKLTLYKSIQSLSFAHPNYGKCPLTENSLYIPWISYHFSSLKCFDGLDLKNSNPATLAAVKFKYEIETHLRTIDDEYFASISKVDGNFADCHKTLCEKVRNLSLAIDQKGSNSKVDRNSSIFEERKRYWSENLQQLQTIRSNITEALRIIADLKQLKVHLHLENCQLISTDSTLSEWFTEVITSYYCARQMDSLDIISMNLRECISFGCFDSSTLSGDTINNMYFSLCDQSITSDFVKNLVEDVHILDDNCFVQNFHQIVMLNCADVCCVLPVIVVKASENCQKTKSALSPPVEKTDPNEKSENRTKSKLANSKNRILCTCEKHMRLHLNEKTRLSGEYEFIAIVFVEFERKSFCWNWESLLNGVASAIFDEQFEHDKNVLGDISDLLTISSLECTNFDQLLTSLTIVNNIISDLTVLNTLKKLTYLDVSFNEVFTLTNLNFLPKLETLKLVGNRLTSWFHDLNSLKFYCSKLKSLNLRYNLWSLDEERKMEIFARGVLTNLIECNGKEIEDIDYPLLFEQLADSKFCHRFFDIFELPTFLNAESWPNLLKRFRYEPIKPDLLERKGDKWFDAVTAMNCENLNLTKLQRFDEIQNLKYLTLNGNPLAETSCLTSLVQLKILHMDQCYIDKLPVLRHLSNLLELSLRHNKLTDLGFCKDVPQLLKLDATDNEIDSLDDIHFLANLNEILIAQNHVGSIQDVKCLKNMKHLNVVDFTGNEIQQTANYRLHSIYLLKHVSVLDHSLVSEEERKNADETFGHTLNLDFLASRFDPNYLLKITHLSLTHLGLQTASLPEDNYLGHLKSLDLSSNKFKYVADLVNLHSLERLTLTGNCVQKICQDQQQTTGQQKVEDESPMKVFKNLKALYIDQNGITKLQPFQFCLLSSTLTELYLQNNKLTAIHHLEALNNLELLDLSNNKIGSISTNSFAGLVKLKKLHLAYNKLKELAYLNDLQCLEYLDIGFNMIQSCKNLKDLDKLKRLATFKCVGNPVCKRNVYEHFVISHLPHLHNMDEKLITADDKSASASTMQSLKKTVSTTNLVHHSASAGDEDESESQLSKKSKSKPFHASLPMLQKPSVITPSKLVYYRKANVDRKTRKDLYDTTSYRRSPDIKNGLGIFGRPCSLERKYKK